MTGSRRQWIKWAVQGGLGFVSGFGAMAFLHESELLARIQCSAGAVGLFLVGSAYLVVGLFVFVMSIDPRVGAKVLFLQDADEVLDLRAVLLSSGIVYALIGVGQVALVLADAEVVSPLIGATTMLFSFVLAACVIVYLWSLYDEFWKQVTLEASQITLLILVLLVTGWSITARFGWGPAVDPLGLIALLTGVALAGGMIAVLRRGIGSFA